MGAVGAPLSIRSLELVDFRCFSAAAVEFDTGTTVLRGENGTGKTSVLEAVAWLATMRSFREAPRDVLVRNGQPVAVIRAEIADGDRPVTLEVELPETRPVRYLANRQRVRRRRDLRGVLRVSTFSPDDLALVQGGPSNRRGFLDETLLNRDPRLEEPLAEMDRVLRQRGALLRQSRAGDIETTLEVWDRRLASAGTLWAQSRETLVDDLRPRVTAAYRELAGAAHPIDLRYRRSWEGELGEALLRHRTLDLARQVTSVGPHRDELVIDLAGRPARTQASQGEQRTVALALRLAAHELVRDDETEAPVLLLDDVFSELDARRSAALVDRLPGQQVVLATASEPPKAVKGSTVWVPDDMGGHGVAILGEHGRAAKEGEQL